MPEFGAEAPFDDMADFPDGGDLLERPAAANPGVGVLPVLARLQRQKITSFVRGEQDVAAQMLGRQRLEIGAEDYCPVPKE